MIKLNGGKMRAMVLHRQQEKLTLENVSIPHPEAQELLIRVSACGICRTDLHILDGELKHPNLPLIMGHQIVGTVTACGENVKNFRVGQRIGVPWLGKSCGVCHFCQSDQENLCDNALYTGYQINGGLAEYCVADSRFCFLVPENYPDLQAAPLFCGGFVSSPFKHTILN